MIADEFLVKFSSAHSQVSASFLPGIINVIVVPGMWCIVFYTHVAPRGAFVKVVSEVGVVHRQQFL